MRYWANCWRSSRLSSVSETSIPQINRVAGLAFHWCSNTEESETKSKRKRKTSRDRVRLRISFDIYTYRTHGAVAFANRESAAVTSCRRQPGKTSSGAWQRSLSATYAFTRTKTSLGSFAYALGILSSACSSKVLGIPEFLFKRFRYYSL